MKKRIVGSLVAFLSAILLATSILPVTTLAGETWDAAKIAAKLGNETGYGLFPDDAFALGVATALVAAGKTDSALYSDIDSTKALLATDFCNMGNLELGNHGIRDIRGIQYLTGIIGKINFSNVLKPGAETEAEKNYNYIQDITPIATKTGENITKYRGSFGFDNNPINNIPLSTDATNVLFYIGSNSLSIAAIQMFQDNAAYLYSMTDPIKQTIVYDLTEDRGTTEGTSEEDYHWGKTVETDRGGGYYSNPAYDGPEVVNGSDLITADLSKRKQVSAIVNKGGKYSVTALSPEFRYYTGEVDIKNIHGNSITYYWAVNNTFYAKVSENFTTEATGGILFTKTGVDKKPLSGAVYRLLGADAETVAKDADNNNVGNVTTGADGVVKWGNLKPGTYYVQEVTPPTGYIKDDTKYPVIVTASASEYKGTITGGNESITVNSSETVFEPDWDNWSPERGFSTVVAPNPLKIIKGSKETLTAAENERYISNNNSGGTEITLNPPTGTGTLSNIKIKIGSADYELKDNLKAAESAINNAINTNALSGDIVVTGTYKVALPETSYNCPEAFGEGKNHINIKAETVEVKKEWEDGKRYDLRPDNVPITLFANGESTGKTLLLTAENKWEGTFKNLPKTDKDGNEIKYTIEETDVTGFMTTYADPIKDDEKDIITLKLANVLKTVDLKIEKVWVDNDNEHKVRPTTITADLLCNGEKIDTITLSADSETPWKAVAEKLPFIAKKNGEIVTAQYSISEIKVDEYQGAVKYSTDEKGNVTVVLTNTYNEKVVTGDTTNTNLYWLLIAAAVLAFVGVCWYKGAHKEEE